MGKGEIARYEQFLLFPQCFLKACFPGVSKGDIVWVWVKYLHCIFQFVDDSDASLLLPISKEFSEVIKAVMESPFYTNDPTTCCLYIPTIDVLNQNKLRLKETSQALATLKW